MPEKYVGRRTVEPSLLRVGVRLTTDFRESASSLLLNFVIKNVLQNTLTGLLDSELVSILCFLC